MQPQNAKANLVRASIAFLVGETGRSARYGLRSRTFLLLAEGSSGPVTRRELGINEMVEVRDRATRSLQRVKATEVSLTATA